MKMRFFETVLPFLLFSALLTGLILIFPILGFLQWISMIPLFIGVFRMGEREKIGLFKSYLYGFLTVFAYYFVIYHWFTCLYPMDFAGFDPASAVVVIIAGWVGLSLLQAIPGGLVFLLYKLLARGRILQRIPLLKLFVFSALWIVFEWSSTLGWTGVPWGRLCLGQIDYLPMLQSASLFGSYFVSFLLLCVNGFFAFAFLSLKNRRHAVLCAATALCLVIANFCFGVVSLSVKTPTKETVRVGVLQGNLSSHEKWGSSKESLQITKDRYEALISQAAEDGASLVIWPETAFTRGLNRNEELRDYLSELAQKYDVAMIVGAFYYEGGDGYNALYWINSDGTFSNTRYAKRHLVPFGEYVPMREFITTVIPPLSEVSMLLSDLSAGEEDPLFESEWGNVGSLICFDSIYESLTLDSVRDGAELMILSSNDSWFFDSSAIYQHQAQSTLRAIESGRYLARSGNTGISSIVSDRGEILGWVDPLELGYAVADVEIKENNTLYTYIGNMLVYCCIAFYIAVLTWETCQPFKKENLKMLNKGKNN